MRSPRTGRIAANSSVFLATASVRLPEQMKIAKTEAAY
jgi:hypothetical protein